MEDGEAMLMMEMGLERGGEGGAMLMMEMGLEMGV